MLRHPEQCPFRSDVRRLADGELAACAIIKGWVPGRRAALPVPRAMCRQCCLSAPPDPARLNDVIASQVYLRAERTLAASESSDGDLTEIKRARDEAVHALKSLWCTPNSYRWSGHVYNLRSTAEVIDPSVDADTFAKHLRGGEPFAYLRYGDGEWLSILGRSGHNGDGHNFFPATLGRELRLTLEHGARLRPQNDSFYMGLNTIVLQDAIRRHLVENDLAYTIHWVCDNLFVLGLRDFSTKRFLAAVKEFTGPKFLVGNETLYTVATGLGCRHVVVPRIDCYREIDRLCRDCRFAGPGLVICCAGMTSECLICRLHAENPQGSYVDCGHVFDALVGNLSRDYTRANADGILEFLDNHYAPLVIGQPISRGAPGGA
jgi:hypothetical protein